MLDVAWPLFVAASPAVIVTPGQDMMLVMSRSISQGTFGVKGPVGLGAGWLSGWPRARPAVLRWIDRVSGTVLVAFGLELALERRG